MIKQILAILLATFVSILATFTGISLLYWTAHIAGEDNFYKIIWSNTNKILRR